MSKADDLKARIGLGGPPLTRIPSASPTIPDHEMLRCIGQGSYGEVWLARTAVGTFRAVKVVYRHTFKDATPYEREFSGIQKYEPISRTNEGLVDVLQIGRNDTEGCFYYVMELADSAAEPLGEDGGSKMEDGKSGAEVSRSVDPQSSILDPQRYVPKTLARELHTRGRLTFDECLQLGLTLNLALGYLHRHGLIHRDVKPSNIIFVNGVPKLADIGLLTDLADAQSFVGTVGFIPPEGPNSRQADIYALGKVLYEASMGKDRQEFPEPFTRLGLDADSKALMELNAILLKACAAPKERYQSAEEMNADLALLNSGKSVKNKHAVERRLKLATRMGAVAGIVALLALIGYFYQQFETREARRLANENRKLAEENHRKAEENRDQLVQMKVTSGIRLADEGNVNLALLWFADVLQLVKSDPAQDASHRLRFQSFLRQCPKLVQIFPHRSNLIGCEFNAEGSRVLTVSLNGPPRIWDCLTGEPVRLPFLQESNLLAATFSFDGKSIATASSAGARVWDAETGEPRTPLMTPADGGVGFSRKPRPDDRLYRPGEIPEYRVVGFNRKGDRLITISSDHAVRIWDATTGQAIAALPHERAFEAVTLSRDGNHVVTAGPNKTAWVWDADTGKLIHELQHSQDINHAEFSPDGKWVATGSGGSVFEGPGEVRVWETSTGRLAFPPLKCLHGVTYVSFSPDGKKLAAGSTVESKLWDLTTKEPTAHVLKVSNVTHLSFSRDGSMLVTASESLRAQIWDVETGEELTPALIHDGWVTHAVFHPNGKQVLTTSHDGTARIWDLRVGLHSELAVQHGNLVAQAVFNRDGTKVLSAGGNVLLWDSKTGRECIEPMADDLCFRAGFSPDEKLILTSGDPPVLGYIGLSPRAQLWDAATGQRIGQAFPQAALPTNSVQAVFSPDGRKIATASADGTARVWDTGTQRPLTPPLEHKGDINSINFSPDGQRLVTASSDNTARVWDTTSGREVLRPLSHSDVVRFAAFSPDGRAILTTGQRDGCMHFWSSETGDPLIPPAPPVSSFFGFSFSPGGKRIICYGGSQKNSYVLDVATGTRALPLLRGAVLHAEFSRDGSKIVTCGGSDGTALVWDASTGEFLCSLKHHGIVHYASFSPDGQRVLTAGDDKTARIWPVEKCDYPLEEIEVLAQFLAGRRIEAYGNTSHVSAKELPAMLQRLRSTIPAYFSVTEKEEEAWRHERIEKYEHAKKWSAAIIQLNELIKLKSQVGEWYRRRGAAFAESGLWLEAAQDFSAVNGSAPKEFHNQYLLAFATLGSGNQAGFQALCEKLLAQFGETTDAETANSLAWLCALVPDSVHQPEAVLKLAEKAASLRPSENSLETLGTACLRAGRLQEALEKLRLGRTMGGSSPEYDVCEAMTQFRLGNEEAAHHILAEGIQSVENRIGHNDAEAAQPSADWQERLQLRLLRREAESLIGSGNGKMSSQNQEADSHVQSR